MFWPWHTWCHFSPGGVAVESSRPSCTCFTWWSLRFCGAESKGPWVGLSSKWSKWSKSWNMFGVSRIPQLKIFLKSFKKECIPMMGLLLLFYDVLWMSMTMKFCAYTYDTLCIFMLFQGPRVYQPHWFIAAQQPLKVGSSIRQTQHTQLAEGWPSE